MAGMATLFGLGSHGSIATCGQALFSGKAKYAGWNLPPLFTEPAPNLHTPAEIGIDSLQADWAPYLSCCCSPSKVSRPTLRAACIMMDYSLHPWMSSTTTINSFRLD